MNEKRLARGEVLAAFFFPTTVGRPSHITGERAETVLTSSGERRRLAALVVEGLGQLAEAGGLDGGGGDQSGKGCGESDGLHNGLLLIGCGPYLVIRYRFADLMVQ